MEITEEFIDNLVIDENEINKKISDELGIEQHKVSATVKLLKEDNTVPFISRYRKEVTGYLDEEQVRDISHKLISHENLETRRIEIIKTIFSRDLLTEELLANINKTKTFTELEELYKPYKRKKKTKAMIAIEKGLEPLAGLMEKLDEVEIEVEAKNYINTEKGVETVEEALDGAMDIIAEKTAHDVDNRDLIKQFIFMNANLIIEGLKEEETSVYKMYYDYKEPFKDVKPHRILAINRGEKEAELKVTIDFDMEDCQNTLLKKVNLASDYQKNAIEDGLKRLLIPSINRELRTNMSDDADDHGIEVFSKNLGSLLMQPPIKKTRIIGIDPGIRTGSKGAALDETGKFLGYFVFYQNRKEDAKIQIRDAIIKYNAELIAIGNGTGSHDVQQVVAETLGEYDIPIQYTVVDEDGASVYSASDTAREEFPDLDLTIRGAISIGRRLQDPLAELVKIDPKSIGVGLYQHDVNQVKLSGTLDEVVESVVNNVGVNANTASFSLLKYVSGVSKTIAKNIVEFRNQAGLINSRDDLRAVKGIGSKVFEQAAGFIKIPESGNPLDNTWVHPENYKVAEIINKLLSVNGKISKNDRKSLKEKHGATDNLIDDIMTELKKPNRDPREDFPKPIMQKGVIKFEDLTSGMKVTGKIKNVVDFGAFVDIGIKESALIHISEFSNTFIKNPHDFLKVGDVKEFKIIAIDEVRKRISLSLKSVN